MTDTAEVRQVLATTTTLLAYLKNHAEEMTNEIDALRERVKELEAELNVVRVSTRFGIPLDCAAESRLIDARIESMKGDTP